MSTATGTLASSLLGLVGFVILFAAAVLAMRWMQRRGGNAMAGGDEELHVVRRLPLDTQTMLIVVQIGEAQYAMTNSRQNGTQMLDRLDSHITQRASSSFGSVLSGALAKRGTQL